jgi:nitrite reductase/ring-hydroxylating ferredoxin subunit/transposase
MPSFVKITPLDRIPIGTASATRIGDTTVALFHLGGRVFAVEDACVRCGSSLAAGKLKGTVVTCSGCGWQYDVTTGCVEGIAALRIDTFEVKIVDSDVAVADTCGPDPGRHWVTDSTAHRSRDISIRQSSMTDKPSELGAQWWARNLDDVDREIARLATICNVRILDAGVIERVLHNDARSHLVRDYAASTAGRIKLHFLSGYAPDLKQVECLWTWLKRHALANFCPDNFAELRQTARGKLKSAQRRSAIIASCWRQAECSDVTRLSNSHSSNLHTRYAEPKQSGPMSSPGADPSTHTTFAAAWRTCR